MAYEIIRDQSEHWDTLGEYETLEEATAVFDEIVRTYQPHEDDCYLELRYYDEKLGDVTQEEIKLHYLTDPETWVY